MELQHIVDRYAEMLHHVDASSDVVATARNRGLTAYQPGVQPMVESLVVPLIDCAWEEIHPGERSFRETEIPYPSGEVPRSAKVDHVMSSPQALAAARPAEAAVAIPNQAEWGIEVKRLQFVGDNGKNGDHEVAKVLSPYLKDRGMLHDALRLQRYGFTRRVAVLGYGFDYDEATLDQAAGLHVAGAAAQTVAEIRKLVRRNGPLYNRPLIEFADAILRMRGWTVGPRAEARFEAWRHPSGGTGVVFAWEIRRPHREASFDPRHPW